MSQLHRRSSSYVAPHLGHCVSVHFFKGKANFFFSGLLYNIGLNIRLEKTDKNLLELRKKFLSQKNSLKNVTDKLKSLDLKLNTVEENQENLILIKKDIGTLLAIQAKNSFGEAENPSSSKVDICKPLIGYSYLLMTLLLSK